jgi:hypothetical protein
LQYVLAHVDIPQWALIYVVSFALLHLAIYYYYLRGEQGEDSASPSFSGENGDYPSRNPVPRDRREIAQDRRDTGRPPTDDEDGCRCPHCGTINEANSVYTYCQKCVQRLGM